MPIGGVPEIMTIFRNNCTSCVYIILGFIVQRLASAMYLDRPSLAKVLGKTRWVAIEHT